VFYKCGKLSNSLGLMAVSQGKPPVAKALFICMHLNFACSNKSVFMNQQVSAIKFALNCIHVHQSP